MPPEEMRSKLVGLFHHRQAAYHQQHHMRMQQQQILQQQAQPQVTTTPQGQVPRAPGMQSWRGYRSRGLNGNLSTWTRAAEVLSDWVNSHIQCNFLSPPRPKVLAYRPKQPLCTGTNPFPPPCPYIRHWSYWWVLKCSHGLEVESVESPLVSETQ